MEKLIEIWMEYYPVYLDGMWMTLKISLFGVLFGTLMGLVLALWRLSKHKILNILSSIYIEFVRGTPMIVQISMFYFGLQYALPDSAGFFKSRMFLGTCAICLNSAAYVAEIIRAGIKSVDKGQMEASRSLGMTQSMAMRYVIVPQAIKNILPALGNEFIVLVKETAVVSFIGMQDLMFSATKVKSATFQPFTPMFIAALIYLTITFVLSRLLMLYERRLSASDRG